MNTEKEHLLAVIVKYIPASDTKGSRVKMTLPRDKKSKTIAFDHEYNTSYQIAEAYLKGKGIEVKAEADMGEEHLLLIAWDYARKLTDLFNV